VRSTNEVVWRSTWLFSPRSPLAARELRVLSILVFVPAHCCAAFRHILETPPPPFIHVCVRRAIDNMVHFGGTNFIAAFEKTLEALNKGESNEYTSNCNKAVLFMTDGVMDGCDKQTGACEQADLDALDAAVNSLQVRRRD